MKVSISTYFVQILKLYLYFYAFYGIIFSQGKKRAAEDSKSPARTKSPAKLPEKKSPAKPESPAKAEEVSSPPAVKRGRVAKSPAKKSPAKSPAAAGAKRGRGRPAKKSKK